MSHNQIEGVNVSTSHRENYLMPLSNLQIILKHLYYPAHQVHYSINTANCLPTTARVELMLRTDEEKTVRDEGHWQKMGGHLIHLMINAC